MKLLECKGCYGDFTENDICEDGYCLACSYESEAKDDARTNDEQ